MYVSKRDDCDGGNDAVSIIRRQRNVSKTNG